MHDKAPMVRVEVARQGYRPDILVHDDYYLVRRGVAESGNCLDILVDDEYDAQLAMRLIYRLGLEHSTESQLSVEQPWTNHELIVYPTEYDFGLYQLQDGLYKVFNFAGNDYGLLRDPFDFIDMNSFSERLAEDFNNEGDRYIYLHDCVIESPYGFK